MVTYHFVFHWPFYSMMAIDTLRCLVPVLCRLKCNPCMVSLLASNLCHVPRILVLVPTMIACPLGPHSNSCNFASRGVYQLRWRYNDRDGVSNHRRLDCLLNHLFRRRSKKTSKLRVSHWPLWGEFTGHRASKAENGSTWWRHHGNLYHGIKDVESIFTKMSHLEN